MNLLFRQSRKPLNGAILLAVVLMIGFAVERSYHLFVVDDDPGGMIYAVWALGGGILAAWLMMRQIAHRDLALAELRQILDLAGEGFSMVDWRTSRYVEVNDAFCRLLGYRRDELVGQPSIFRASPISEGRARQLISEIRRKGRSNLDIDYVRKDGSEVRLKFAAALLRDGRGRPARVISFVTDITTEWQAEQNAVAAKERIEAASRAKNRFLMSMSHELRTPLNAIIGFSDILLNPKMVSQVADKQEEYLNDIRSSGYALLDLVGNVIDMARIEADELDLLDQAIDLRDVVRRIARQVQPRAGTKGIVVAVSVPDTLPELYGDLKSVNRMIGNLVSNAIKFSGFAARVSILVAMEPDKSLRVTVTDTGRGIAPEAMGSIFEPFSPNPATDDGQREGSRLGLAVTKHLIEAHGGRIEIVSTLGKGTSASLYFPPERTALDDLT